jgi:hypothetical protein
MIARTPAEREQAKHRQMEKMHPMGQLHQTLERSLFVWRELQSPHDLVNTTYAICAKSRAMTTCI